MTPGIRPLIAGNWKMNGLKAQLPEIEGDPHGVSLAIPHAMDGLVCVPFTLIGEAAALTVCRAIDIRRCRIATQMLPAPIRVTFPPRCSRTAARRAVIVGHSERRTDHGETSETVKAKAEAALRAGILPIVCIGETRAQREAGETLDVLKAQLEASLPAASDIVVAYEPVWAIGTGLDARPSQTWLRRIASYGTSSPANTARQAGKYGILYGGIGQAVQCRRTAFGSPMSTARWWAGRASRHRTFSAFAPAALELRGIWVYLAAIFVLDARQHMSGAALAHFRKVEWKRFS